MLWFKKIHPHALLFIFHDLAVPYFIQAQGESFTISIHHLKVNLQFSYCSTYTFTPIYSVHSRGTAQYICLYTTLSYNVGSDACFQQYDWLCISSPTSWLLVSPNILRTQVIRLLFSDTIILVMWFLFMLGSAGVCPSSSQVSSRGFSDCVW